MFNLLAKHTRAAVFAVCAASVGMGPGLSRASAQDDAHRNNNTYQNQNGQRDYSNNSYYQMGQREGQQDRGRNKQRNHRHHYKNNEDRQAYQSGYQNSWGGNGVNRQDSVNNQRHDDDNRNGNQPH